MSSWVVFLCLRLSCKLTVGGFSGGIYTILPAEPVPRTSGVGETLVKQCLNNDSLTKLNSCKRSGSVGP